MFKELSFKEGYAYYLMISLGKKKEISKTNTRTYQ